MYIVVHPSNVMYHSLLLDYKEAIYKFTVLTKNLYTSQLWGQLS